MDLITSLSIELEYFIYLVMVTCHLKRATINEAYIKKTKRKRVANATPINSIGFLKTPTNYIEPERKSPLFIGWGLLHYGNIYI